MKNKFISIFIFICYFFNIDNIYAFTPNGVVACYEDTGNITVRKNVYDTSVGTLECGTKVEILGSVETGDSNSYKYLLTDGKIKGYVSGHYIITTVLTERAKEYYNTKENIETYKNYLKEKKFPDSYIPYLLEIHARHPNWEFTPEYINLNFNDVIYNEKLKGNSLIHKVNDFNYRSTEYNYNWLTDQYSTVNGEDNWYYASEKAVSFYLDPRNYLNEKYIFAMEGLNYVSGYHDVLTNVLKNSFVPAMYSNFYKTTPTDGSTGNYVNDIANIGFNNKLSTIHIGARILQEVGINGGTASSGNTFSYCDNTVKGFNCYRNGTSIINANKSASGYFNLYNIRAVANNYNTNIINGLIYAMGGLSKTETSYFRPWNTPYRAINGGAMFLAGDYVSINQDTLYYQKFDVSTNNGNYTHQYQQNIVAPISEGGITYGGYYKTPGILDIAFAFTIPVYNNMPSNNVTPPVLGSPNYYLKDLKVNGTTIENFVYNKLNYKISVPVATNKIKIDATKINSQASIAGTGDITLNSNNQDVKIIVTAGNGEKITYTINVIREDDPGIDINTILNNSSVKYNDTYIYGIKPGTNVSSLINNVKKITNYANITINSKSGEVKTDDSFRTGDTVTISSNKETKKYTIIIYGDLDGNGEINKSDLLLVKRHVYGYNKLSNEFEKSSDVDKDGDVDKSDLLIIKRQVYGYGVINQG